MDTKNKTRDVDALLQKALCYEKPDAELLRKVKHELSVKEKANMNKPGKKRYFARVAAVVAATLALTTTVFAAGAYLGGFDRLREIIGSERAELLQPLEIDNIPEVVTHESHETETTENYIPEHGIRIEIVAVGVFDNIVDVYITMEDMIGNRLDDYFRLGHVVAPVGRPDIAALSLTPEIINRTDCGIITLRSREIFTHSVAGMELTSTITGIHYNIRTPYDTRFRDLALDFTTATAQPYVMFRPDMSPSRSGSGIWSTEMHDVIEERMLTDGFPVLQPHLHNLEIDLGGEIAIISTIGIIEDRLHIQIYRPFESETPPGLMLINSGDSNQRSMHFGFTKDMYGNLVRAEVGIDGTEAVTYLEYILFDVDLERLSDIKLYGRSFLDTHFDRLDLDWSVDFEIEPNDIQIAADELSLQYESAIITEIRVSPFLIQLVLEDEVGGMNPPEITIHTTTGSIHLPVGTGFSGFGAGNFFYDMIDIPLDMDTIISVEIGGDVVMFN
ncbi:MAG: hypothetical protein FWC73_06830 [Defluviitaleaceae bacterium]|nr:hypothetical protein [Defluviitaleaceae bacterium]